MPQIGDYPEDNDFSGAELLGWKGGAAKLFPAMLQKVYTHSGGAYVAATGRLFIGSEDPEDDGFTLVAGDIWIDTT